VRERKAVDLDGRGREELGSVGGEEGERLEAMAGDVKILLCLYVCVFFLLLLCLFTGYY